MQSHYPEAFERDMACSLAEWESRLPSAIGKVPWERVAAAAVQVRLPGGWLELSWSPLPDRVIALMRMPRLAVRFRFVGVPAEERLHFMRHFDLVLQRGGG
ncbi:hypothetical protein [Tepidicella baoligensis]|uniref:hypothetical protein n=1 Tax=Tepidicella baoligensis TaxID=2707016 RepID=UPI0015D99B65